LENPSSFLPSYNDSVAFWKFEVDNINVRRGRSFLPRVENTVHKLPKLVLVDPYP
jgi:hypothetical protein